MKIVFIGSRDIHLLGGIENYMYNISTRLVRMGHEAVVYCESDHNATENVEGVKVIYMKGPKSNLLCKPVVGLKATLRTVFREKGVSLIHYNAWPASLWSWIATLAGIPSLMMGHGHEWQRSKYSPRQQKILKVMERYTAHSNRHLLMCSDAQTRYFAEHYKVEAYTMPTAVDLPAAEPASQSDILQRYGLEHGKYFLYMGRLVQDKNPDKLIRGFKAASHQSYKLVIAGSNDAMPQYVSFLHDLAAGEEDIVFTGAVYGADKDALLRGAYMFCLPSTIEGLSIVLLEAMSYRLPVLASDIEANREVLEKDKALWVRPENVMDIKDSVERAIASPSLLESFREYNYRKVADKYTWDRVTHRYVGYVSKIAKF